VECESSLIAPQALARRPKLLLLDEPTSGVSAEENSPPGSRDPRGFRNSSHYCFRRHDMDIVSKYADRVVAFYNGRILADGEPSIVLKDNEVRRYVTGGVVNASRRLLEIDKLAVEIQSMQHCVASPCISRGAMVSLVGRNGAGKTTLMRSITALAPRQGTIRFGGEDLAALPRHARAGLGIGHAGRPRPRAATDR
jgi:ABC-type branched-subunit amino acid transport system ATPase component